MYVCTFLCLYVVYVCMYVCMHVCMYVCMYVCRKKERIFVCDFVYSNRFVLEVRYSRLKLWLLVADLKHYGWDDWSRLL